MNYTNLHLHDYYSTLDGYNTPAEYMVRAKELGMTHLAQTNHGTLSGHRAFQVAAKDAGIVPILGLEAYISPTDRFDKRARAKREDGTSVYNHIILLAKGDEGLHTLNRLSAKAYEDGFYFKPRIDRELLFSDNKGIIVLSGCRGGLISEQLLADNYDGALALAKEFKAELGDAFYIEVQSHNPVELNAGLLKIADELGIKPVTTADCHYANKDELWKEEALLILSTNPKRNFKADLSRAQKMDIIERFNYLYPDRTMTYQEIEIYLRDYQSEIEAYAEQGITRTDIYENTNAIAAEVEAAGAYPFHEGLDLLPKPKGRDAHEMLREQAYIGLRKRGLADSADHVQRLEEELAVVKGKGFDPYFIVVGNTIRWAKSKGIRIGPGRGSGAGALLNYCLYITDIDPLKYGLLFFRFLDPSREDWPDVDIDIQDSRRHEVKEYAVRQYKHVSNIITMNTWGGKGAIKDAAKVLGIPFSDATKATKDADVDDESIFFDVFKKSKNGSAFLRKYPEVLPVAEALHGRIRGTGMHAGGLIVAKDDIFKYAPLETAKDPNDKNGPRLPMVAYDMNDVAEIGLIKIDYLGLKAMTIIDDTLKSIEQRHGKYLDLFEIDLEDKNVYEMLSKGHTKGVFQCEARPYTGLIIKMGGVWSFNELAASNALVRPGAANTIGKEYIAKKDGKMMISYVHKDAKWFTEDTYGEVLYQEQVMLMMTEIAGMSMQDANKVRRIIGKKKNPAEFEAYKERWLEGAKKKIKTQVAEKLWSDFEAHAGYSFNKSHAVAYSMVSYWTAWLKYYYPAEFMASVLRNETDKDAITDYLIETKRLGIGVLLPNVNKSHAKVSLEGNDIRLGLESVKFISDKISPKLIEYRPYNSYAELEAKVKEKGSGLNVRVLTALNAIGAATFPDNPRTGKERENLYEYVGIPAFTNRPIDPVAEFKFRTLDDYEESGVFPVIGMVRGITRKETWARADILDETGSVGVFCDPGIEIETGQRYAFLVADNRIARYSTIDGIIDGEKSLFNDYLYDRTPQLEEGQYWSMGFRTHKTREKQENMGYIITMDHLGDLRQVMAWPSLYNRAVIVARPGAVFKAEIKELDGGGLAIKEFK